MYRNNQTSIIFIKNTENQYCTKYIDIYYYRIYKLIDKKKLKIK